MSTCIFHEKDCWLNRADAKAEDCTGRIEKNVLQQALDFIFTTSATEDCLLKGTAEGWEIERIDPAYVLHAHVDIPRQEWEEYNCVDANVYLRPGDIVAYLRGVKGKVDVHFDDYDTVITSRTDGELQRKFNTPIPEPEEAFKKEWKGWTYEDPKIKFTVDAKTMKTFLRRLKKDIWIGLAVDAKGGYAILATTEKYDDVAEKTVRVSLGEIVVGLSRPFHVKIIELDYAKLLFRKIPNVDVQMGFDPEKPSVSGRFKIGDHSDARFLLATTGDPEGLEEIAELAKEVIGEDVTPPPPPEEKFSGEDVWNEWANAWERVGMPEQAEKNRAIIEDLIDEWKNMDKWEDVVDVIRTYVEEAKTGPELMQDAIPQGMDVEAIVKNMNLVWEHVDPYSMKDVHWSGYAIPRRDTVDKFLEEVTSLAGIKAVWEKNGKYVMAWIEPGEEKPPEPEKPPKAPPPEERPPDLWEYFVDNLEDYRDEILEKWGTKIQGDLEAFKKKCKEMGVDSKERPYKQFGDRSRTPSEVARAREEDGTLADYARDVQEEWFGKWTDYRTPVPPTPDTKFKIYRAVPDYAPDQIRAGDYVSQSAKYAKTHLDHVLRGEGKIIEGQATMRELVVVNPNEFWYAPEEKVSPMTACMFHGEQCWLNADYQYDALFPTVGDRVIWYIYKHRNKARDGFVEDPSLNQRMISERLGISRAHVAIEQKRMTDAGLLRSEVKKVLKGGWGIPAGRNKIWTVTEKGINYALQLKEAMEDMPELKESFEFGTPGKPHRPLKPTGPMLRSALATERLVNLFQRRHFPDEDPFYPEEAPESVPPILLSPKLVPCMFHGEECWLSAKPTEIECELHPGQFHFKSVQWVEDDGTVVDADLCPLQNIVYGVVRHAPTDGKHRHNPWELGWHPIERRHRKWPKGHAEKPDHFVVDARLTFEQGFRAIMDGLMSQARVISISNTNEEIWAFRNTLTRMKGWVTELRRIMGAPFVDPFPELGIKKEDLEGMLMEADQVIPIAEDAYKRIREVLKDQGRWEAFKNIRAEEVEVGKLPWYFPQPNITHK